MKIYQVIILLATVVALWLLASCRPAYGNEELQAAEEIMESKPDSAYGILKGMDLTRLGSESQRARYALLMSIALDKNYIDTTGFAVLQPAIDYYPENGTADEKLKTYYYQGVIYSNRRDFEKALESFSKALLHYDNNDKSATAARLLVAKGILHADLYDFNSATECYLRATKIYEYLNREDMRLDCLLNALNGSIVNNDKDLADSLMSVCEKIESADIEQTFKKNRTVLAYHVNFSDKEKIKGMISGQSEEVLTDSYYMIDLALAHHKTGNNIHALELLESLDKNNIDYDTLKYESVKVMILDDLGDYKNALSTYYKLSSREFTINETRLKQESHLIEEKLKLELTARKESEKKTLIIWICSMGIMLLISIIITLIFIIRNHKTKKELALQKVLVQEQENIRLKYDNETLSILKNDLEVDRDLKAFEAKTLTQEKREIELERDRKTLEAEHLARKNRSLEQDKDKHMLEAENLMRRIADLESEREQLQTLLDAPKELPAEVQNAIKIRVEMINELLAKHITKSDKYGKPYEVWINELTTNIEAFLNSNRLAFSASHPAFIDYLERHGLTLDEINYVCLYALGLRSKDVGAYMKRPSHVNTSSRIRKKLGLDVHSTNLGIYIRKLLKGEIPEA